MSFWRSITDFHEKYDPLFKAAKKGAYQVAKQDSDNMEGIGRKLGWDWLTQEAQRNQQNPGRAIGKAAVTAATIYGGGLLGGAGGAGGAAANAAGTGVSGVGPVMSGTAYEAAIEAAKQAAANGGTGLLQSGTAASNGLLPYGGELASVGDANAAGGLLGGSSPQSVHIAHNTAFDALKNANSFGEGMGNLKSWAMDGYKSPMSMSGKDAMMGMQGLQMMEGQQQPQPMAPPPRPAAPPPQSDFRGYGSDPLANMSEEDKRKLLLMMQQHRGML